MRIKFKIYSKVRKNSSWIKLRKSENFSNKTI